MTSGAYATVTDAEGIIAQESPPKMGSNLHHYRYPITSLLIAGGERLTALAPSRG